MAERDVSPPNLPFKINPKLITAVVVVILLAGTAMSSVFMVDQTEEAVVLRLGQYARTVAPGLHFKLPFTIERNYNVPTQVIQTQSFGFRTEMAGVTTRYAEQSFPQESIMLTGDLNIVDVEWIIQYRITDPRAWLFNVESHPGGLGIRAHPAVDPRDPDHRVKTIRDVSQSVINLLAGDRAIIDVLGNERSNIEFQGQERMNEILSAFDMGVLITQVRLQNIVPPVGRVQDAFEDVNRAVQDRSRLINEGRQQYNAEIPRARGEAQQIVQQAEGYAAQRVNRARGETARFGSVLTEYQQDPGTTRTRLYYEMMEDVFADEEDVELIDRNLQNFIPLLNLQRAAGGQQ